MAAPAVRAGMHCGWMDRAEWTPDMEGLPPRVGPDAYDVDICPGWLVRQPAVEDGAQAYAALEQGALEQFDPHGLNIVWEMASIAKRAFNLFQAERQRALAERNKRPI